MTVAEQQVRNEEWKVQHALVMLQQIQGRAEDSLRLGQRYCNLVLQGTETCRQLYYCESVNTAHTMIVEHLRTHPDFGRVFDLLTALEKDSRVKRVKGDYFIWKPAGKRQQ